MFDDKLGQQLLAVDAAKLSFEVALKKSEAFERAHRERRSREVNAVGTKSNEAGASAHIDNRQCYRCGSRQHVANFDKCPAKFSKCHACSKIGHFKSQCRLKNNTVPNLSENSNASVRNVRSVSNDVTDSVQSSSDGPTIFSLGTVNACNTGPYASADDMKRQVVINGKDTVAIIDTGASVNVLPLGMFPTDSFSPTQVKLNTWGATPLNVERWSVIMHN